MSSCILPPSISHDHLSIFAVLAVAGATGHRLGQIEPAGRALSAPVCAMALTFALASTGVLPPATPQVAACQMVAVQCATPLLLLSADLRAVGQRAGRLLPSFCLGTLGSLLGGAVALQVCGGALTTVFGVDGIKAAAALTAKNIGGGLNFVAVAAALQLSPGALAAALAIDNVMALVYFPLCAWLGRDERDPLLERDDETTAAESTQTEEEAAVHPSSDDRVGAQSAALAIALAVAASARALAARFAPGFDLPLATFLTVALATAAPRALAPISSIGGDLGTTCIFLFFATAGWTGGALGSALLTGGPPLLAFLTILYAVHLAVVLGVGAAVRRRPASAAAARRCFTRPQLLVASNANIGGPPTASALAVGNGWSSLVTPSLLVGNLGYAIATPLGVLFYQLMH
jgi:uncharacterized membrane protein